MFFIIWNDMSFFLSQHWLMVRWYGSFLKSDLENFQMVNEVKDLLNSNHHGYEECLNYCMHVNKKLALYIT